MNDLRTSFALLVGNVSDAIAMPATLRSPVAVQIAGIGTPPTLPEALWTRTVNAGTFVIASDSGAVPLDHDDVVSPGPRHLAGVFDLHFVVRAEGYVDLPVTVACNHDAVPIASAYAMQPQPVAIRGRVTSGNPPVAVVGAGVSVVTIVPSAPLPATVMTATDGTYAIPSVPAARSLTLSVSGTTQTIAPAYPVPVITVNFAL